MALYKIYSKTVSNREGTNTVFDLYQELGSAPSVKTLKISNDQVKIFYQFGNNYGDGVLTWNVELKLLNTSADDFDTLFFDNPPEDFQLRITVDGNEYIRAEPDPTFIKLEINDPSKPKYIKINFKSTTIRMLESGIYTIRQNIDASTNPVHDYRESLDEGGIPISDFFAEFLFENAAGYGSLAEKLLISHPWQCARDDKNEPLALFKSLKFCPSIVASNSPVKEIVNDMCRSFAFYAGWSITEQQFMINELRNGHNGSYWAKELDKDTDTNGFRKVSATKSISVQTITDVYKKFMGSNVDAIFLPIKFYLSAITDRPNISGGTNPKVAIFTERTEKAFWENPDEDEDWLHLKWTTPFDPYEIPIDNVRGLGAFKSTSPGSNYTVDAQKFSGWKFSNTSTEQDITYCAAWAHATNKCQFTRNVKLLAKGIVDPMKPFEINNYSGTYYRAIKGYIDPINIATYIERGINIAHSENNIVVSTYS